MNLKGKVFGIFIVLMVSVLSVVGQGPGQTVRGQVRDGDSEMPLAGATVVVKQGDVVDGSISDVDGQFKIANVPLGRVDLQVKMEGYEVYAANGLLVTAGKELVLTLDLSEALGEMEMEEVLITDGEDKREPLNEMAGLSARSFSVEETKRYPAAIFDPARMAQNFAGVSSSGNDMSNEIVIRGNSPRGMLWRLEGIEIPNPNHFGDQGSSGGPISMLSSSTLANSDFYTGAFPAEFGNAYSGVFDLRLRKGNNETRESSFMLGVLGVEASTEGYFSKSSKASYLVNYRYSTLALMQRFVPNLDGVLPVYQDLSFHINVPTSAGTFSLFGLGGKNKAIEEAVRDTSQWESRSDGASFTSEQMVGVAGLKHKLLVGEKTYLQTVVAASADNYEDLSLQMIPERAFEEEPFDITDFQNYSYRVHTLVNHKFDARNTLRAGVVASHLQYNYLYDNKDSDSGIWTRYVQEKGQTNVLQGYAQWKRRIGDRWTLNTGFHATHLALNGDFAFDPRASLAWQAAPRHKISVAVGQHSKPEHPSTYFLEKTELSGGGTQPNKDLEMLKAQHIVLGHDFHFGRDFRLKTEVYYQRLSNIPVEADSSDNAIINATGIWDVVEAGPLVSEGTGRNFGVDLTFEKFFSDSYFLLVTGSLYQSEFTALGGTTHPTRFNGNYNTTFIGGKEWKVGKAKKHIIGVNGKFVGSGGNRYTPINFAASEAVGSQVLYEDQPFASRAPDYWRIDVGCSFTLNARSTTHSIMLDIQNLTNRQNVWSQFYDSETNSLEYWYQNGIFPLLNYRVEF